MVDLNQVQSEVNANQIRKLNMLVDVVRDLTSGRSAAEVIAKSLAIDATTPTICLWLGLDCFGDYLNAQNIISGVHSGETVKQQLYQSLNTIVRAQSINSFASLKNDEFVVFLKVDTTEKAMAQDRAETVAQAFQRALHKSHAGLTVSIGIGPAVRGLEALIVSLHDVQRMVELHQRNRQYGRIFFTEDLGIDRLLLQFPDSQELLRFAEGVLGAVIQTDKTNGNHDLLNTLAAYFGNNRSIAETAKVTHLHQNTVRYRLDRIKELLGGQDWFSVEMAVRVCQWAGALHHE